MLDEAALLAGIGDRLARFKQPRRIVIADELPRNTMGKVQKNLLRERYRDVFKALKPIAAARRPSRDDGA